MCSERESILWRFAVTGVKVSKLVFGIAHQREQTSHLRLERLLACSSLVVIRLSRFSYLSGFKLHFQFVLVTKSTYQAL